MRYISVRDLPAIVGKHVGAAPFAASFLMMMEGLKDRPHSEWWHCNNCKIDSVQDLPPNAGYTEKHLIMEIRDCAMCPPLPEGKRYRPSWSPVRSL